MFHFAGVDDGDRFKATVRVLAHATLRAIRREGVGTGIVQQQERTE